MNLQTKILEGAGEDYLILVARGALTEGTLRQTLEKISATTNTHGAHRFLVDLQYTTIIRKGELEIDEILRESDLISSSAASYSSARWAAGTIGHCAS